jgi:electron transfer flavoprotein beta subunit
LLTLAVCLKPVRRTDVAVRLAEPGGVLADGGEPVLDPAAGAALATALRLRSAFRLRLALPPGTALGPGTALPPGTALRPGSAQPQGSAQPRNSAPDMQLDAQPEPRADSGPRLLALAVGPAAWEPVLRAALAAGADEVLRVWPAAWPETLAADARALDGSGARTLLHAALAAEALRPRLAGGALLALTGESSADEGHGCFGAFLAQALGLGFAHRVQRIEPAPPESPPEARPDAPAGWSARVKLERGYTQELALERSAVATVAAPGEPLPEASWPAWLASRTAPIPLLQPAVPGDVAPETATALRPPRPRVKRISVPASSLSAEERIRLLVGGLPHGGAGSPSGGTAPGGSLLPASEGAQRQAEAIAELLKARGYLKE